MKLVVLQCAQPCGPIALMSRLIDDWAFYGSQGEMEEKARFLIHYHSV